MREKSFCITFFHLPALLDSLKVLAVSIVPCLTLLLRFQISITTLQRSDAQPSHNVVVYALTAEITNILSK
jgi:hypothetical protein